MTNAVQAEREFCAACGRHSSAHPWDICQIFIPAEASETENSMSTERNKRVQARYDELMREGKHGHYETLFRVVREEVERERASDPLSEKDPQLSDPASAIQAICDDSQRDQRCHEETLDQMERCMTPRRPFPQRPTPPKTVGWLWGAAIGITAGVVLGLFGAPFLITKIIEHFAGPL